MDPTFIVDERISDDVHLSANKTLAVERGRWTARFRIPDGKGTKRVILVTIKQVGQKDYDGVWRIVTESYFKLELDKVRVSKL